MKRILCILSAAWIAHAICSTAQAQIGSALNSKVGLSIDSGPRTNLSGESQKVFESEVSVPDAPWFRLDLVGTNLQPGSILIIKSDADGAVQTLDRITIDQWGMTSAFFNGSSGTVTLIAGPGTRSNRIVIGGAWVGAVAPQPVVTLCDGDDDRVADTRDGIARMVSLSLGGPCSAAIISDTGCFYSAGHCINFLEVAQFNVPESTGGGSMQHPSPSAQYVVNPDTLEFANNGTGDDWAYFVCFANTETSLTPLQAEGIFYPLADSIPPDGTLLRITGFGSDDGSSNYSQQTDTGPLHNLNDPILEHRVDTMGGNSGSSIIIDATDEVIAIHTHGGCGGGANSHNNGTAITHPQIAMPCPTITGVPTTNQWGALVLTLGLLACGTIAFGGTRRHAWNRAG